MPNPLDYMMRGFAWSTGRRLAYQLPLPIAIAAIILFSLVIFLSRS